MRLFNKDGSLRVANDNALLREMKVFVMQPLHCNKEYDGLELHRAITTHLNCCPAEPVILVDTEALETKTFSALYLQSLLVSSPLGGSVTLDLVNNEVIVTHVTKNYVAEAEFAQEDG